MKDMLKDIQDVSTYLFNPSANHPFNFTYPHNNFWTIVQLILMVLTEL